MGSFWFLDYWICERPCLRTSPKNFFSMGAIQGLSNNGTIERLNYLFWRTINAYWMIWPAIMKSITYRSEQASRTVNDTSMALWPVGLVSSYATLRERYLAPSRDLAPSLSLLSGFSISQNTFESLWIREDLTKWVTIHEHYHLWENHRWQQECSFFTCVNAHWLFILSSFDFSLAGFLLPS